MIQHLNEEKVALRRPLNINYEQLTEGDDEFKKEILTLMVKNLEELQHALHVSIEENQAETFSKACHKTKITLSVLNDDEFQALTSWLGATIKQGSRDAELFTSKEVFDRLCSALIESLRIEAGGLEA